MKKTDALTIITTNTWRNVFARFQFTLCILYKNTFSSKYYPSVNSCPNLTFVLSTKAESRKFIVAIFTNILEPCLYSSNPHDILIYKHYTILCYSWKNYNI